jgi:surface antigen
LRVTNWMARGKLFLAITLTSLVLVGCSTPSGPTSSNMVIYNDKPRVNSTHGALLRFYENSVWRLPRDSGEKHVQAVYFAIMNLDDGVVTEWYDSNNNTQGQVRVNMTIPKGGGYCRLYESAISYKYRTRTLSEMACTRDFGKSWTFHAGGNR